MGRSRKSLQDLVRDGTFRRRKHEELLDEPGKLPWPELRALQARYRRAKRDETRSKIALEFERVVRDQGDVEFVAPAGSLREILEELGPAGSAKRAIAFFPRFFRHTKGPRAGKPFELDEFQKAFLREFFRRDKKGQRVYQRGYFIVPGGNGKSPLAAGLAILGLAELEDAPEIYCVAGAKGQAHIVLGFAQSFVKGTENEPAELQQWLRVSGTKIRNVETGGSMEVLPSSGGLQEGRQPSIVIIDELWAFETKKQEQTYVAMSGKLHKRSDSYLLAISTAGRGSKNILLRIIKAGLKFKDVKRRGSLTICRDVDKGILVWMYDAPKEAPIDSLQAIRAANPASWIEPRDIMRQLHDEGVGEAEFRRIARNEWVAVKNQWLPPGAWEKLADPKRGLPPEETAIVLGFDGSYDNDSTALVGWTVGGDDYGFVVAVWERPEDEDQWIVPRREVKGAVDAAMRRYKVLQLICDPPGWYEEVEEWGRVYGDVVTVMFPTNQIKMMSEACREFYSAVVNAKLSHDGHETLSRHLANAFVKETIDGAYITKEYRDSPNKIDTAIAAVVARYMALRAKPKRRRVASW